MSTENKIKTCLKDFLKFRGKALKTFNDDTHLFFGLGLKSEDGVYFVLDLCDALEFEFPLDFNPFVNNEGTKLVRVGEMVSGIQQALAEQEHSSEAR